MGAKIVERRNRFEVVDLPKILSNILIDSPKKQSVRRKSQRNFNWRIFQKKKREMVFITEELIRKRAEHNELMES